MKYGDPVATWRIAADTYGFLREQLLWEELTSSGEGLVLTSSAFGAVPTASYWVAESLGDLIEGEGMAVQRIKFEREGGFGCHNYSQLDFDERLKVLEERKIWLAGGEDLQGKTVIVFDDLRSTGAHEESLREVLEAQVGIRRVVFLYYVGFNTSLAKTQPQEEDVLNHVDIRDLNDLYRLSQQAPAPLLMNARLVKFFLKGGASDPDQFTAALSRFPQEFLLAISEAAQSRDGYANRPPYQSFFEVLQSHLFPTVQ